LSFGKGKKLLFVRILGKRLLITAEVNQFRNLALYQLAITNGMRQGELLGLKWQDVKWEHRTLRIQRQLLIMASPF
jgi:integrase